MRKTMIMGKHIDAIKRQESMTPQEVMASFIWERAVMSQDHFFSIPYYEYRLYIEYCQDNATFLIDVYYLKQEQSFALIQPDWNSVLATSKQILEWLENVYASTPHQPVRAKQRRKRDGGQNNTQSEMSQMAV